jgi:hypothetical protein
VNSLVSQFTALMALAPDYLPPCPNCSLRSAKPRAPEWWRARHSGGWTLSSCCKLSDDAPIVRLAEVKPGTDAEMAAQSRSNELAARRDVANWWKLRRQTGNAEMLALFRERGLTEEMEATK